MRYRSHGAALRCDAIATLARHGLTTHALAEACSVDEERLHSLKLPSRVLVLGKKR